MSKNTLPALMVFVALFFGAAVSVQAQSAQSATNQVVLPSQHNQQADRYQSTISRLQAEANSDSPRAERAAFELFVIREKGVAAYISQEERVTLMQRYQQEKELSN